MEKDERKTPESYSLSQNFPNPFNLETQIHFKLSEAAQVKINIFDLTGEMIRTILNERKSSGDHILTWDGLNDKGERVASGVYFYKLEINSDDDQLQQTRKMLMLK